MNIRKRRADRKHHSPRRNHTLPSWRYPLLFALLCLLLPLPAYAQEPGPTTWEWRTFTADNSPLTPGGINMFFEDSQGRIWIGTWGGLNLYQEGTWQTFHPQASSLVPGLVREILEDSQGRIWIAGSWGLDLYEAGTWQTFTTEDSPLTSGGVSALLEDSRGHIWIGTSYHDGETGVYSGGLSLYQDGEWQTFTSDNSSLAPGGVSVLLEDSQGRIWVGISYYDSETDMYRGSFSLYQNGIWQTLTTKDASLAPGTVREIVEDSQGRIWVSTFQGVSLYQDGVWQILVTEGFPYGPGMVRGILEDSQGRIWISTSTVNVYEDGTWQTSIAENAPDFASTGAVDAVLEDSQGRIWVDGDSILGLYEDGVWQAIAVDTPPVVPLGFVRQILEDSQGRIWVGTGDSTYGTGGLMMYQDGNWEAFTSHTSPLVPGEIYMLFEDPQGRIWVGTGEGLSVYQQTGWQTFTPDYVPLARYYAPNALQWGGDVMMEDSQGRIWVGGYLRRSEPHTSKGGLCLYQAGEWQTFTAEDSPLAPGWINALLEDSQGGIWIGTTKGFSLYQEGIWQTFTYDAPTPDPEYWHIVWATVFLKDSQDRIWIGTSKGVILHQAGAWQTFTADNSSLAPGWVSVLLEDSQGGVWVGASEGISLYNEDGWQTFTFNMPLLAPGEVNALLEDSQGRIWAGTYGGVSLYREGAWQTFTSDAFPPAPVLAILEDIQGRVWVSTYDGISLYQEGAWQTFTYENAPLYAGGAWELTKDSQGHIWLGSGGYLSIYREDSWQTFTSDNSPLVPGSIQQSVERIFEDSQGRLWICVWDTKADTGSLHLYREGTWQTFTVPGRTNVLLEDSQGRIWISSGHGLSVRRPGDQPCAFIRSAGVASGKETTPISTTAAVTLTSPSSSPSLIVSFAGVDLGSESDSLLFLCQLMGYDQEEVSCTSPIRYPALTPGTYTFQVRALDEDLLSSEPATATITLVSTAPPTPTPVPPPTPTPIVIREPATINLPGVGKVPTVRSILILLGGGSSTAMVAYYLSLRWRRARRLVAWRRGADPYVVGDAIEEPERFYGREPELTDLIHSLEAGNHIALYGERRIGKTSLLHQLSYRLRSLPRSTVHFLPLFINLQMISESRFFSALAGASAKAAHGLLEHRRRSLPLLRVDGRPKEYDSQDLADDLEVVIEAVQEVTDQPPRIVLLLDEADKMNGYDPHTQERLRGLLMTPIGGHVKLVWSGQAMNREWHLEGSPWYNLFKREIHLGGLEEEAALHLIREPVRGVFTYTDEAVQRILELTDRKPYPIQRLCSLCIRRLLAESRFRVTTDDVEAAWRELQAEDARRAAEGATDLAHEDRRPAWTVAEKGAEYRTGKEDET